MEIDITQRKNQFAGIPIPDFIDMILGGDERADEAMYKVRWHILETDKAYTSVFPMAVDHDGLFYEFVPIQRKSISASYKDSERDRDIQKCSSARFVYD